MKIGLKYRLVLFVLFFTMFVHAQEYRFDAGINAGVCYYIGDYNQSSFYSKMRESFGVFFRYNHDLRSSFKFALTKGRIAGEITERGGYVPDQLPKSFHSHIYDFGATYEFNFFPYSDQYAYMGTQRFTPYITAGVGCVYAATGDGSVVSPVIPFGVGVKYKVTSRLNIGGEFSFKWAFTDRLDLKSLDDPYYIESSVLKNNDWYSFTHLYISYEFGRRNRICNSIF